MCYNDNLKIIPMTFIYLNRPCLKIKLIICDTFCRKTKMFETYLLVERKKLSVVKQFGLAVSV